MFSRVRHSLISKMTVLKSELLRRTFLPHSNSFLRLLISFSQDIFYFAIFLKLFHIFCNECHWKDKTNQKWWGSEKCWNFSLMILEELLESSGIDGNESQKRWHRFQVQKPNWKKTIFHVLETQQSLGKMSSCKENQVRFLTTSWRAFRPFSKLTIKYTPVYTIHQQHSYIICLRNEYR